MDNLPAPTDTLPRLTQGVFDAAYQKHEMFTRGQRGGIRA